MKQTPKVITTAAVLSIAVISLVISGCTASSQSDGSQGNAAAPKTGKAVQYTCSMHPEVVQDKPGNCPKCGMMLVEKH